MHSWISIPIEHFEKTQVKVIKLMQNFPTIAIRNGVAVHRQFSWIDVITLVARMVTVSRRLGKQTHTLFYNIKTNSADSQGLICGPHVDFRW